MDRTKFNIGKDKSKRTCDNIVFDSCLEMKYYRDVILPQVRSGNIVAYELQKPYELQPKFAYEGRVIQPIKYVADFFIQYADGKQEVIDTKGCPDSVAKIKRKMFTFIYPDITYKWITYVKKYGGWVNFDYVNKLRKENKKKKENLNNGKEAE